MYYQANAVDVALRKESVDRNFNTMQIVIVVMQSLSARRAWIEMICHKSAGISCMSLSARRAWIEISTVIVIFFKRNTSLSARRAWIEIFSY